MSYQVLTPEAHDSRVASRNDVDAALKTITDTVADLVGFVKNMVAQGDAVSAASESASRQLAITQTELITASDAASRKAAEVDTLNQQAAYAEARLAAANDALAAIRQKLGG
jgi:hypothetical protein